MVDLEICASTLLTNRWVFFLLSFFLLFFFLFFTVTSMSCLLSLSFFFCFSLIIVQLISCLIYMTLCSGDLLFFYVFIYC